MDVVFALALIWGLAYAIVRGTEAAGRAVKQAYRRRVSNWLSGNRPGPAPAGVKLGAGLATAVTGAALAARGFAAGVRAGWPEGRQKAHAWWEARNTARQTTTPADTETGGLSCVGCSGAGGTGNGRPHRAGRGPGRAAVAAGPHSNPFPPPAGRAPQQDRHHQEERAWQSPRRPAVKC